MEDSEGLGDPFETQCVRWPGKKKNFLKQYANPKALHDEKHRKFQYPVLDLDLADSFHCQNPDFGLPAWEDARNKNSEFNVLKHKNTSVSAATLKSRKRALETQSAEFKGGDNLETTPEDPATNATNFSTDPNTAKVPIKFEIFSDLQSNLGVNDISEVREYLAKPVHLTTVNWPSTYNINGILYQVNDLWAIPSAVPTWLQKLYGYYGLKATLCLSFQINSTPYSAGRLRAAYYPVGENNQRKADGHFSHMVPFSQLPGVFINAQDPSTTLKIPYVAPSLFYELTLDGESWGTFSLRVVSPYATGVNNAQSVDVVIWAWMEDVELIGQTNTNIVTQSADYKKVPSEEEGKPFTNFFRGAATAVHTLDGVPFLSAYTGTVGWALDCISGICSIFGWSKPLLNADMSRVGVSYGANTANSTGMDPSHSVAVLSDAKLEPITNSSLDSVDEMSFSFIKKQWSYLKTYQYDDTMTTGDLIADYPVIPAFLRIGLGANEVYHTPVSYLANLFQLFRGGIEFKFVFVKTPYHRGQLLLTYQPGPSIVADLTNSTYMYREVIDLADTDEVTFTVPYLNPVEYLDCTIAFGRWDLLVTQPLRAPETVKGSIDIEIHVRGADNFEVMRPIHPDFSPYVVQSAPFKGSKSDAEVSGIISKDLGCVGNAPKQVFCIDNAVRCASELVLSINSLLKRYSSMNLPILNSGDTRFNIYPYIFGVQGLPGSFDVTPYQSYLVSPYAFFRGGVRILTFSDFAPTDVATANTLYQCAINHADAYQDVYTTSAVMDVDNVAWTGSDSVNGPFMVQAPYQSTARLEPIIFQVASTDTTVFASPRVILEMSGSDNSKWARAFADDFQLMFWVGVPRMATR